MTATNEANRPSVMVWQDEDANAYWAEGHIDPEAFLAAVDADLAECGCDPLGEHERKPEFVSHAWFKPKDDDEDYWLPCKATDEGAQPFTKLPL